MSTKFLKRITVSSATQELAISNSITADLRVVFAFIGTLTTALVVTGLVMLDNNCILIVCAIDVERRFCAIEGGVRCLCADICVGNCRGCQYVYLKSVENKRFIFLTQLTSQNVETKFAPPHVQFNITKRFYKICKHFTSFQKFVFL